MFTSATGEVTTGSGDALQTLTFEYPALQITPDVTAQDLVKWYGERYSYARIVKLINTHNHREEGNTTRRKYAVKPEVKLMFAMQWAMANMPEDFAQRASEEKWLLKTVWPQCASAYFAQLEK